MRLTEDVHVVGGGDFAFNISHRLDCHVYLIKGEKDLALVDSGFDEPEQVLKNIQEDGFDPGNISRIFITHYHADHTGGLARLRRMLGATVVAGAEAAPTIRAGDADQIGLTWAQGFGFFPPEYRWEASEVDVEMTDADRFDIGGLEMTAIATPGHCHGALLPSPPWPGPHLSLRWRSRLLGRRDHSSECPGFKRAAIRSLDDPLP